MDILTGGPAAGCERRDRRIVWGGERHHRTRSGPRKLFGKATSSFRPSTKGWSRASSSQTSKRNGFVRVNSSMCRMLGYSEEELLAASIKDIHPPEELPDDLQRFQAAAEGRVSINEDRPVLRKDGSIFYADITGHPILYEGRPCLLALFRDVTGRRQAQAARERERRTLKHMLAGQRPRTATDRLRHPRRIGPGVGRCDHAVSDLRPLEGGQTRAKP